jgi:hypothetical protein
MLSVSIVRLPVYQPQLPRIRRRAARRENLKTSFGLMMFHTKLVNAVAGNIRCLQ